MAAHCMHAQHHDNVLTVFWPRARALPCVVLAPLLEGVMPWDCMWYNRAVRTMRSEGRSCRAGLSGPPFHRCNSILAGSCCLGIRHIGRCLFPPTSAFLHDPVKHWHWYLFLHGCLQCRSFSFFLLLPCHSRWDMCDRVTPSSTRPNVASVYAGRQIELPHASLLARDE